MFIQQFLWDQNWSTIVSSGLHISHSLICGNYRWAELARVILNYMKPILNAFRSLRTHYCKRSISWKWRVSSVWLWISSPQMHLYKPNYDVNIAMNWRNPLHSPLSSPPPPPTLHHATQKPTSIPLLYPVHRLKELFVWMKGFSKTRDRNLHREKLAKSLQIEGTIPESHWKK